MTGLQPIPLTVVGGYLGAGKTTLVNHLLRQAEGRRLAVLLNEFGELAIDEDLIEVQGDDLISLAGGCVCCSYGSDLVAAIRRLAELRPRPDHVVLEASGVALPGSIASTLSLLREVRVDCVAVLVDAETIRARAGDRYVGDTIERQLAAADIVLLNKIDLPAPGALAVTRDWLRQTASAAIVETQDAAVPPALLLQGAPREVTADRQIHSQHAVPFETCKLSPGDRVDVDDFVQRLRQDHPQLVRAKGFIEDCDGTMKTIQIVGKRCKISTAPAGARSGVVVISLK